MSFLDEVDSLRTKLGVSRVNPVALIGIAFVAIAVVVVAGLFSWGYFTSPGLVIEKGESSSSYDDAGQVSEQSAVATVFVHVAGAVQAPGMVELPSGSRVSDAVNAAGGFSSDADQLSVNLARQVTDGEQIVVGSVQSSSGNAASPEEGSGSSAASDSAGTAAQSGKVNINTATAEQLTALKGVGDATAQKIVEYRQQNGSFKTIEDIKNVSGIGDKRYAAIKDSITV